QPKPTTVSTLLLAAGLTALIAVSPAAAQEKSPSVAKKSSVNAASSSPYAPSDAQLFASLDYAANPALAPVKRAADAGDIAGAKKAMAAYLRTRTSVPWSVSPRVADRSAVTWNSKAAEDAERGQVGVVTIGHLFPNGEIDWHYDATGGTSGLPKNNEWTWQLNRMSWWRNLASAYQATGDERWASAWVRQFRSWVAQNPPPERVSNGVGSTWRTIESGIRMSGNWPEMYHIFLLSPSVTDDDLIAYVKTAVTHARYLAANPSTGNWLTMEMNGLYGVGALFPEFTESKSWRKQAGEALYKEASTQFLPDGAQIELTPGYHNVALSNVLGLYQRAKMVGRTAELPTDYTARLERAFDFNLYLMTPDRDLPRFNDSWPVGVRKLMTEAAALFPERKDFQWVATDGKSGTPPAKTSYDFRYAGYRVMRSDWEPDANYAVLDSGPLGYGHVHQDKLNLVIWAYGREILFDGGGGSYEASPYRSFATDTFGHNTVLVDGKPQRRDTKDRAANVAKAPISGNWVTTAASDQVSGTYDEGYGAVGDRIATHKRTVTFTKGANPSYTVIDTLTPNDDKEHTYQVRWHLLTTATETNPTTQATVTNDAGKPNLLVLPLGEAGLEVRSASAQTSPELLGWNVRKDLDPQYVPATTVLHTRRGKGVQSFVTVLVPIKAGEQKRVKSVERAAAAVQVRFTDGKGDLSIPQR
ncbi:MAG: alginate lyase family protein, partial [Armatimonadota bacterium]